MKPNSDKHLDMLTITTSLEHIAAACQLIEAHGGRNLEAYKTIRKVIYRLLRTTKDLAIEAILIHQAEHLETDHIKSYIERDSEKETITQPVDPNDPIYWDR